MYCLQSSMTCCAPITKDTELRLCDEVSGEQIVANDGADDDGGDQPDVVRHEDKHEEERQEHTQAVEQGSSGLGTTSYW